MNVLTISAYTQIKCVSLYVFVKDLDAVNEPKLFPAAMLKKDGVNLFS